MSHVFVSLISGDFLVVVLSSTLNLFFVVQLGLKMGGGAKEAPLIF